MRIAVCEDDEQSFVLQSRDGIVRIVFARLEYVEVIDKVVSFHLTDGYRQQVTAALTNFEKILLDRPEFLKVHRSYVVNLNCVRSVGGGEILTDSGHSIPVARQRRSRVRDAYMRFLLDREESQKEAVLKREHAGVAWNILLVDDEPSECARWSSVLCSHGCVVEQAANGEEALGLAAEKTFDCVLLDVMLPGEDGFLLCGKLGRLTQAPVVFLSSLTEVDKQTEGFSVGGADYITKDTPAGLFWAKVETRIKLSLSDRVRLRYGPLLLDLSERRAYMEGAELNLTSIEFDLLRQLSEQAGRVFSPRELFVTVWGERPWDGGQTVQMHMSRLRRKLEKAWKAHDFIETVWGQGYRFILPEC